jgi:hypothetical protein
MTLSAATQSTRSRTLAVFKTSSAAAEATTLASELIWVVGPGFRDAGENNSSPLFLAALTRQPLCPQALAVGIKCLLRSLMVAHGLFSVGSAGGVASPTLFRGENTG